jgi:hypothetical protein
MGFIIIEKQKKNPHKMLKKADQTGHEQAVSKS